MAAPVIITGPQGCGKTLNASALAQAFGCNHVVDDWSPDDPVTWGALHLITAPVEDLALAGMGLGWVVREYDDAALSCGLAVDIDGALLRKISFEPKVFPVPDRIRLAPPARRKRGAP